MHIDTNVGLADECTPARTFQPGSIFDHREGGQRYRVIQALPTDSHHSPCVVFVEIIAGDCTGERRMMLAEALVPYRSGEVAA